MERVAIDDAVDLYSSAASTRGLSCLPTNIMIDPIRDLNIVPSPRLRTIDSHCGLSALHICHRAKAMNLLRSVTRHLYGRTVWVQGYSIAPSCMYENSDGLRRGYGVT